MKKAGNRLQGLILATTLGLIAATNAISKNERPNRQPHPPTTRPPKTAQQHTPEPPYTPALQPSVGKKPPTSPLPTTNLSGYIVFVAGALLLFRGTNA